MVSMGVKLVLIIDSAKFEEVAHVTFEQCERFLANVLHQISATCWYGQKHLALKQKSQPD